jgi:4-hydroxy-3-polyprenylbenzoate decarboxylase
MLAKVIIVVDHDVDVQNTSEVAWKVSGNLNPETDVVFTEGPLDDLDYSSPALKYGSKIGIDATSKSQADGFPREWPEEIVMAKEIIDRVNERWQEFNL